MKILSKLIVLFICILLPSQLCSAATIASPKEDEQVYAGSTITVIVKPDPGEQWQGFVIGFKAFEYDSVNNIYKITIQVPNDVLGYRDDLRVLGVDNNNGEVVLSRRIFVKLQPNVVLQSIVVGDDLMVLHRAPSDSSPEDKERIETDQISVAGVREEKKGREENRDKGHFNSGDTILKR
jgi:hypothetical protein